MTRFKILLHAFAGRRRRGDIEWFLTQTAAQHEGFTLLPVSVDIVIDSTYGDISQRATREFWLHYMRMGHIAGFIAGPPCNTWSRARAIQLSGRLGPRVVRTTDFPWGLESLRLGELRQVMLGTILLSFAFESIATMAIHGGSGLLEHPQEPTDASAVSIWKLPVIQLLLQFPQVRLINVAQGLFGAATSKPTTLLALRLPSLEMDLHAGLLTRQLPKGASIGRDESGAFRTAPLKEYPPGLCKSIADAFSADFNLSDFDASTEYSNPPSALLWKCHQMHDRAFGAHIGKD